MREQICKRMMLTAVAAGLMLPATAMFAADTPANSNNTTGAPAQRAEPGNQGDNSIKTNDTNRTDKAAAKLDDRQFIEKAVQGGLAEVKLGELAQTQASSPDVKQFAQRMVDDHGKANTELKQLARSKNIEYPTELKGECKENYDKLAKLKGQEFDRAYIKCMVKDHQEDIREFKDEAQSGKDPEIQAWASKTLPTLQEHAQMIDKVAQANGVEGAQTAGNRQTPDASGSNQGNHNEIPGNGPGNNSQGNTGANTQSGNKPQK